MAFTKYMNESELLNEEFNSLLEAGMATFEEIGKELGITKVAVKKRMMKIISSIYTNLKKNVKEASPKEIFMTIAKAFNVEDSEEAMRDIFNNLSNEQKKELMDDLKSSNN